MFFSRHTLFTAMVAFTILTIIAGYIIRHANWKTLKVSYIIVFLCVIRLLFPFEFSSSNVIEFEGLYAFVDHILRIEVFGTITILQLLFFIWVIGTLICFIRLAHILLTQWNYVKKCMIPIEHPLYELSHKCCTRVGISKKEKLCISPHVSIPGMIGFFNPIIVLPMEHDTIPKEHLYYILCHELYHFKGNDLWIKLGLELICSLLWWNPAVYLLRDGIDHLLELRCDKNICSISTSKERAEYTEVLTSIAKNQISIPKFLISEYTGKKPCIISRFEQILPEENNRKMQKKNTHFTIVLFILVILLFLLSYCFTLQPAFQSPPVEYETTIQDNTNNLTFILRQSDGTLMYFENGIHRGNLTVDMLEEEPYCNLTIREGY